MRQYPGSLYVTYHISLIEEEFRGGFWSNKLSKPTFKLPIRLNVATRMRSTDGFLSNGPSITGGIQQHMCMLLCFCHVDE